MFVLHFRACSWEHLIFATGFDGVQPISILYQCDMRIFLFGNVKANLVASKVASACPNPNKRMSTKCIRYSLSTHLPIFTSKYYSPYHFTINNRTNDKCAHAKTLARSSSTSRIRLTILLAKASPVWSTVGSTTKLEAQSPSKSSIYTSLNNLYSRVSWMLR